MTNAFIVLQLNTLARGEKFALRDSYTRTHIATNNFQAALTTKLLLTGTHLGKRVVAMLSYSPVSTLHAQVTGVYTQ